MPRLALLGLLLLTAASSLLAADANRLTYLDEPCDPYYPHRNFPKLTTPQWVGEEGVECVVVLAIDDMRDPEKYEQYLRPILDRLKQIDGRAPVSIMTNQVDPRNERLQQFLHEGLSLEIHTFDHPCPCLQGGDFAKARQTYERCVDLMHEIPGNRPVAFRMPCCDSLNTPSPRFWIEIFNQTTAKGNFLSLDSSVFNVITSRDESLPDSITLNEKGEERFRRYIPFPSFVNTIEDYPYPYVIGRRCWQFPCMVPSDWEAQHVQKPNNPDTVRDMKLALDATVLKQGVYCLVFHPHGWIRSEQVADLIDHAVKTHGKKVKFLNFRECDERIRQHLLAGQALRGSRGEDQGVRLLDVNGDGYQDVVLATDNVRKTRLWNPDERRWTEVAFPAPGKIDRLRFGILNDDGRAACLAADGTIWQFDGAKWVEQPARRIPKDALPPAAQAASSLLHFRDLDLDGRCELIGHDGSVHAWNAAKSRWERAPIRVPIRFPAEGDPGARFVDLDADGDFDLVAANEDRQGVWRFESLKDGWKQVDLPNDFTIPRIARDGKNNGAWFHSQHLWVQNEDTQRLPDHVDRRSFAQLLSQSEERKPVITPTDRTSAPGKEATAENLAQLPPPQSPEKSLASIAVPPGMRVELVAAEPLIVDPIAFDWGPDGRLWVVEMRDYPRGLDERGAPGGRVKVLTDTDGDGRYDKAQLFLDGLPFPTGVKVWRKGILVTAAPDILYAEDTDGDDRADVKKTLFRGFGEGNQQHRANGLRWGLDNWLYVSNGDSGGRVQALESGQAIEIGGRDLRIRPDTHELEAVSGQTQYSLCFDDVGNRFGGNNSNPVWHYQLEDYHLRGNPLPPPTVRVQISERPGAAPIFPRSKTLTRFNDYHAANRFTSACGIEIYRDHYLGDEFYGNSFVCEPVHNLVHRELVAADGITFKSRRAPSEQESEFLASTDNWFRPVMARTGPDGALYIADMYRLVIEHPQWIPDDWQAKLNLRAGDDKGRIYRVVRTDRPPAKLPRLDTLSTAELAVALDSPSGTRRDLVQQLLLWRNDVAAVEPLTRLTKEAESPLVRMQALCTLDGLDQLDTRLLTSALADASSHVRRHAVRIAAAKAVKEPALAERIIALADDADPQVQREVAFALRHIQHADSGHTLAGLALRHLDSPAMTHLVLGSLRGDNLAGFLKHLKTGGNAAARLRGSVIAIAFHLEDHAALSALFAELTDHVDERSQLDRIDLAVGLLARLRATKGVDVGKLLRSKEELAELFDTASALALDSERPLEDRIRASRLLFLQDVGRRLTDRQEDYAFISTLLGVQSPLPLQQAALEAVADAGASFPYASLVGENWRSYTPQIRRQICHVLMSQGHAAPALRELLTSQDFSPRELDAAGQQRLLAHPDAQVRQLAARRLGDMRNASDTNRATVVEQHAEVLRMTGDVARGRAAFIKHCTSCHRLEGEGKAIGPDLLSLTDRSPQALLIAMLDPNRAVEDKYFSYLVVTVQGQIFSGLISSETGTSLTLFGADGKERTILRSEIETIHASQKSLMPEGLERDIRKQELADIIAYVRSTGAPPKEFAGNKPETVEPDDRGALQLAAASARIYGPRAIFESQYKNIGYWADEEDFVEWSLRVSAAGKYRVRLDYACADYSAGSMLQVTIAGQKLHYKVASTGTWDDYRTVTLGEIELAAGPAEAVARSLGPVRTALLDLRTITLEPLE